MTGNAMSRRSKGIPCTLHYLRYLISPEFKTTLHAAKPGSAAGSALY